MKLPCLLLVMILLAACSPVPQATSVPVPAALAVPTTTPSADVQIDAWVNRPGPARDQVVTIYGTLYAKGRYMQGLTMTATWPDETHEQGTPNCWVRISYELGICVVPASRFPAGKPVPITVTIEYEGVKYTTQTSFTPRGD